MRKYITTFLKVELPYIFVYLLSSILIICFYTLSLKHSVEIIYPMLLSLFLFLIFLCFRFFKYVRFQKALERISRHKGFIKASFDTREAEVLQHINDLHKRYQSELEEMEQLHQTEKRLISAWVHNMKSPLTVTDLIVQRVRSGELSGQECIEAIAKENDQLLSNLDHILTMLRLAESAKDFTPRSLDLLAQLTQVINDNKSLFINSSVYPKIETNLQNATILADSKWNAVLLKQLISNSIKYSMVKETPRNVRFLVDMDVINGRMVLKVIDEGIGIPSYDLPKVFEAFYTGDNGRKGYNSSGIGLYFCKEICEMFGANINITSNVGHGTTVSISYLTKL